MDAMGVVNPNAVEFRLERHLFKKDSDGRLHGSGKYRRYLFGEDVPGEHPIELAYPYLRDEHDPLNVPLWRFFDYSQPTQAERWEIFNTLNPIVQSQVLHLLADVRDPSAEPHAIETRLRAIHMEGNLDALAGLIFAGLETRSDTRAASQANYQIHGRTIRMFAGLIIMSPHGYRNWRKLLLPLLVRRYLCYPFDVADPAPHERRFVENMWESLPNSVFMTRSFAGGLLIRLTRMGLVSSSTPSQWAFLAHFVPIAAPGAVRQLRSLEERGIVPDITDLTEPLRSWVNAANQHTLKIQSQSPT